MTDYDRGAYTPQTDAPLAFDPRRPSERRPMPMALIGSAVVLVVLLAGVAMVYRGGVRHAGESPRPVGEPVMAVKTAPPLGESASTAAPPTNMDVYDTGDSSAASPTAAGAGATGVAANQTAAAAPTFVAPAEQPAARPAPKPATVAMLAKPTAPNHIERRPTPTESAATTATTQAPARMAAALGKKSAVTPAKTTTAVAEKTESRSTTTTVAKTTAAPASTHHVTPHAKLDESELAAAGMTRTDVDADADAQTPAASASHKAKPVKLAAASPPATDAVAPVASAQSTAGKAVVQIGAFSSSALADKGYADVSAALPSKMSGKAKHVQSLDKDGTTLYRTWLSGFATRADAQAFCDALKAKGKTCLVRG